MWHSLFSTIDSEHMSLCPMKGEREMCNAYQLQKISSLLTCFKSLPIHGGCWVSEVALTTLLKIVTSILCQSTFCCCDKIPKKTLKGGQVYFNSWFQRFHSIVGWLHCFGVCGRTEHHGGEHFVEWSCSPHCGQEAKREGKGRGFQGHSPSDLTFFY